MMSGLSFALIGSAASTATSAKDDRDTDHEAKVVPIAVVVHFVDANILAKQGNDKSNRRDDSVLES
jgi:hypothetical protein